MKKYTLLSMLALASSPALADVNPEYFCHDLRGHAPGENNDVWSDIATFWKNHDGLYELRIAGPNLTPGLVVPGKKPTRYTRSVTVVFGEDECRADDKGGTSCHRTSDLNVSPIWVWGGNEDIGSSVTKVSRESPESAVRKNSIKAQFNAENLWLEFTTILGKTYDVKLHCDAPSWVWYPHIPLDELEAKLTDRSGKIKSHS